MSKLGTRHPVFLAKVAQHMLAQFGPDFRRVAVVFNNQRPIQYLQKHLADQHGKALWSPNFFTIQDFFRRSTTRQEINQTAQLFLLHRLHTDLQRESNPNFEESLDHFFPIAEIILQDFAQLDYELVPVDRIFMELSEIAQLDREFDFLSEEQQTFLQRFWSAFSRDHHSEMQARFLHLWRFLPRLYARFKLALEDQQVQHMAGIYRDLAESSPEVKDPTDDFDQVIFIGFNALNACESLLFKKWQDIGKATFYFDADSYYLDDPRMEAGLFIRQNLRTHGLVNALGDAPQYMASPQHRGQIHLIAAPGYTAQAKLLAQRLRDRPAEGSVAVILADESLIVPVLQSIPEEVKVNVTMGYPIQESLIYGLIQLVLEAQLEWNQALTEKKTYTNGLDHGLLLDFLGHPFIQCPPELRFQLLADLAEFQEPRVTADKIKVLLPDLFERYPIFLKQNKRVPAFLDNLLEFLEELAETEAFLAAEKVLEQVLLENAVQALRQVQNGLLMQESLSVPLAIKLIRRQLGKVTATLSGDPLDGVQIMGILESRNLNFDYLYVLGANEGNLPPLQSAASFIPYNLRRAYGMPVIDNQQALSAYLFYRLLHGFDQMDLYYNAVIDEQSNGEVSRFARQIQYESQVKTASHSVSLKSRKSAERVVAGLSPNADVLQVEKTPEIWEKLALYLHETPADKRRRLSASAFAMYLNSPLEFFLRYIADIKEPPSLSQEMESNRIGSVIHRCMEFAYSPFLQKKEAVLAKDIQQILKDLPQLCQRSIAAEFYNNPTIPVSEFTGQQRIMLKISEEYCRLFLQHDLALGAPIQLRELENDEDYVLEFPIQIGGEENSVLLRGIIDRVDEVHGQKRIVDYKTGGDVLEFRSPDSTKETYTFFQSNWKDSNKALIQTLYYTHIYEQIAETAQVEPHLYSVRRMRNEGTLFKIPVPRKEPILLQGEVLADVKAQFHIFLKQKLEELFDPSVPFIHPADATVYPGSPYAAFLVNRMTFPEDPDAETSSDDLS